jgi:hypothetical protein
MGWGGYDAVAPHLEDGALVCRVTNGLNFAGTDVPLKSANLGISGAALSSSVANFRGLSAIVKTKPISGTGR